MRPLPALLALPLVLAGCAAAPVPPCFVSGEQAARMASSSAGGAGSVLSGSLGTGCVTLAFDYARSAGSDRDGTLAIHGPTATLTVTGLATDWTTGEVLTGPDQARMTLVATFAAPPAPGAEAASARVVLRRLAEDGTVRESATDPGGATARLTLVDLAAGRVEGWFTADIPYASTFGGEEGRIFFDPYRGTFSATVAVSGGS